MRNTIERLALSSIAVLWVFAVLSIPIIPERCVVCGERHGEHPSESLRNRTVMEWLLDDVPDIHFSCFSKYNKEKHNPDGGIK